MSSATAEGAHSKQSTLELGNEVEPSEQIHHIESRTIENVPQELGTSLTSILSEQLQPFSKHVAMDSLPQLLGQHSTPQLTTSEKAHDFGWDVCTEPSENQPGHENSYEQEYGKECGESFGQHQHQPGSKGVGNEPPQAIAAAAISHVNEQLESFSGNVTNISLTEKLDLPNEDVSMSCQTEKTSRHQQVKSELKHECGARNQCTEPSEQKHHVDSKVIQNETGETNITVSTSVVTEQYESISENRSLICDGNLSAPSEGVIKNCQTHKSSSPQQSTLGQAKDYDSECVLGKTPNRESHLGSRLVQYVPVETSNAASDFIATDRLEPPLGDVRRSPISKQPEQPSEDVIERSSLEQFDTSSKSLRKTSRKLGRRDKRTSNSRKKKYMLRSLVGSDRVLRSRTQEKPKSLESSDNLGNAANGVEKKRKHRKKRREKTRVIADEFLRIRKRLRYFLHRIKYEQSLIDAYSSEGWKGNRCSPPPPQHLLCICFTMSELVLIFDFCHTHMSLSMFIF